MSFFMTTNITKSLPLMLLSLAITASNQGNVTFHRLMHHIPICPFGMGINGFNQLTQIIFLHGDNG